MEKDKKPFDTATFLMEHQDCAGAGEKYRAEIAELKAKLADAVQTLEEIVAMSTKTLLCDPADFDFDAEKAYEVGANNAFCSVADDASDCLAKLRGEK